MIKSRAWAVGAGGIIAAVSLGMVSNRGASASGQSEEGRPPAVVVLSTIPGQTSSHVISVTGSKRALWATFEHVPNAVTRGALLPDTRRAVVVTDTTNARDLSWAASLILVQPKAPPRVLVDRVYHASTPLALQSGHVLVQRGVAGVNQPPDSFRVDDLTIDDVDPDTATVRTVHSWRGFETHLAGVVGSSVLVYRVGPGGADLVAVDLNDGAVRVVIPSWPPFARDFSVDPAGNALVVQQLAPDGSRDWVVERVDLTTGQLHVVARSQHRDLVPFAWPNGSVLYNAPNRRRVVLPGVSLNPPHAGEIFWGRSVSPDGHWVGGLWKAPGKLPRAVVVRAKDGVVSQVSAGSQRARVDVVGVMNGGGA